MTPDLVVPDWLSPPQRAALVELVERNDRAHGDDLLGIVLSGSAGRNYATEHSDLDVMVVLADEADAILIDHDRLDDWINFAYRALKSDRDGRAGVPPRRQRIGAVAA